MEKHCAILFDLDGTLVNSEKLSMSATMMALKEHGYEHIVLDEDSYHYGARYVTPERLSYHATGRVDDSCGQVLAKCYEDHMEDLITTDNTPLYDEVTAILNHLSARKEIEMGVLSNASTRYVNNVMNIHQLQNTFRLYYGAEDVTTPKPSPDGLNAMLQELHIPPSRSIYVGDSPTDGTAAAKACMYSIGVTWGNNSRNDLESNFDEIVTNLSELQTSIEKYIDNLPEMTLESKDSEEIKSPRRRVSWKSDVVDNENMNKYRTDDEYWDVN